MEDWINFEFSIPDFGGILRGNSSSDGVNNQVLYLYTLKTSSNSSSFVTYLLSKSTSENRQNIPKNQASSGQSARSVERKRKCSGCGSTEHIRTSQKCSRNKQQLDDANVGGGNPASGDSEDDGERSSVEAQLDSGDERVPTPFGDATLVEFA